MISNREYSNKESLLRDMANKFSARGSYDSFSKLYPFSNEYGYDVIIKTLKQFETRDTQKETISLVFGESNFISLLPALSSISNILLLADISKDLHEHTSFLLDCFKASANPTEFWSNYSKNNPVVDKRILRPGSWRMEYYNSENLLVDIDFSMESAGKYHFLDSEISFDNCKNALDKITILPIYFNVADRKSCENLNSLLHQYNAEFSFCNFTNIREYQEERLDNSIQLLLKNQKSPLIMFSTRNTNETSKPRPILTLGLRNYLLIDKEKDYSEFHAYVNQMQDIMESINRSMAESNLSLKKPETQKINKIHGVCYLGFLCSEMDMKDIVEGKLDINSLPQIPACDSENELKKIVSDFYNEVISKGYTAKFDEYCKDKYFWSVTFYHAKEKIIPYLRQFYDQQDRIKAHLKIYSSIIKATKIDGSMTIEKEADKIPNKYKAEGLANSKNTFFKESYNPVESALIQQNDDDPDQGNLQSHKFLRS